MPTSITPASASPGAPTDVSAMRARNEKVLASVAESLGMSAADLTAAVRSGSSLSDVAASKGVSQDQLLAAVKQGLSDAGATGDVDALAQRIATRRPHGHHHHHHHAAAGDVPAADSASTAAATPPTSVGTVGTIVDRQL